MRKIPWLFVSLSISFGVQGLLKTFEVSQHDFTRVTTYGVPMMLAITVVLLAFSRAGGIKASWNSFLLILLIFVTVVFASFLKYVDHDLEFVSYVYVNFVFLLFSALQYWHIKSHESVEAKQKVTGRRKERVTEVSHEEVTFENESPETERSHIELNMESPITEEEEVSSIPDSDDFSEYGLSKTEREIIEQLLEGATYQEIATKRMRSYSAISSQASNAFSKLNVSSKEEFLEKFKK